MLMAYFLSCNNMNQLPFQPDNLTVIAESVGQLRANLIDTARGGVFTRKGEVRGVLCKELSAALPRRGVFSFRMFNRIVYLLPLGHQDQLNNSNSKEPKWKTK